MKLLLATTLLALTSFPLYLYFFRKFNTEIRTTTSKIQEDLATLSGNSHTPRGAITTPDHGYSS